MLAQITLKPETREFFEKEISRTKLMSETIQLVLDHESELITSRLSKAEKKEYQEKRDRAAKELNRFNLVADDLEKLLILTK